MKHVLIKVLKAKLSVDRSIYYMFPVSYVNKSEKKSITKIEQCYMVL